MPGGARTREVTLAPLGPEHGELVAWLALEVDAAWLRVCRDRVPPITELLNVVWRDVDEMYVVVEGEQPVGLVAIHGWNELTRTAWLDAVFPGMAAGSAMRHGPTSSDGRAATEAAIASVVGRWHERRPVARFFHRAVPAGVVELDLDAWRVRTCGTLPASVLVSGEHVDEVVRCFEPVSAP